jgi:hypothetical protein
MISALVFSGLFARRVTEDWVAVTEPVSIPFGLPRFHRFVGALRSQSPAYAIGRAEDRSS